MRYRCLVLDHDDTVVNSTARIHFPCFMEFIEKYAPRAFAHGYSLEEYVVKNFDPGVISFFHDEVGLSWEEMAFEQQYWFDYAKARTAAAYPGIREILEAHRAAGGILCVVSHSYRDNILRDYQANSLPEPDLIFGWECPPEQRKPNPWPLEQICRTFHLDRQDLLMIDDLKPGYDMATAYGVDFAAAGWAFDIKPIEDFMRNHCKYYFKSPLELQSLLRE